MDSPPLRFEVTPAEFNGSSIKRSLLWGVIDAALSAGSPAAGSGAGDNGGGTVRKYPEVAVYNSVGTRRVLDEVDTDEAAEDRATAIEDDYKAMDIREWCALYIVPFSFVNEVARQY
jgi:hypothetical protein